MVQSQLSFDVEKTKEIVVDFRRASTQHPPLSINGAAVERVSSTKFLGLHLTEDLRSSASTSSTNWKEPEHQSPLCTPSMLNHRDHPDQLHHCVVRQLHYILPEDPAAHNKSSWEDHWCPPALPPGHLEHKPRWLHHPTHCLFSLLPSGRRMRSLRGRTSRLRVSFIHQAIRLQTSLPALHPSFPALCPHKLWTLTHPQLPPHHHAETGHCKNSKNLLQT